MSGQFDEVEAYNNRIAIIGMSCRFPGANNPDEFWDNLVHGKESIIQLTDDELKEAKIPNEYMMNENYIKAAACIHGPDLFDASFFGYSNLDARTMDPQHRILLELAYLALEDAGYDTDYYNGRIGVYTGTALNSYFYSSLLHEKITKEYLPLLIGNDKDFVSTKISYKLDLKGPSINVQTACSTGLVAIHLACQSLFGGETDMILAGTSAIKVPHKAGYFNLGTASKDGHIRTFDAEASGTVFGSGAGVVVLKRLEDAINDGDNIYAVINGSAVNNDGAQKAGYTGPGIDSQADVIIEAIANSGISARNISYVETHGAGTVLGDSAEINALTKAFRVFTNDCSFCALGSVKPNIGHLDVTAGMSALIKTALALHNKHILPNINYHNENPRIDFQSTPFFVSRKFQKWKSDSFRVAGVFATGIGGTNAFVLLEEAPELKNSVTQTADKLIILSAKTEESLQKTTAKLKDFLIDPKEINLDDVAYTLQIGRKKYRYRSFIVCGDKNDATCKLSEGLEIYDLESESKKGSRIIFNFTDEAAFDGKIIQLFYNYFTAFKDAFDSCSHSVKKLLNINLADFLTNKVTIDDSNVYWRFAIQYSLGKLLLDLNIVADIYQGSEIGNSIGACLEGIFNLEESLMVVEFIHNKKTAALAEYLLSIKKRLGNSDSEIKYDKLQTGAPEFFDARYWLGQSECASNITDHSENMILHFGTHQSIDPNIKGAKNIYSLFVEKSSSMHGFLAVIGRLWTAGLDINWKRLEQRKFPRRVSLPGYEFIRKSYWIPDGMK